MKGFTTPFFEFGKTQNKSLLLRMLICIFGFNLFTTMPSLANAPVVSCESCAIPGVTPQTYITGAHAVIYAGRLYDSVECKTYFLYCAVNDGGSGGLDISHTVFGDPHCGNTCLEDMSLSAVGEWSVDNNNNVILDDACEEIQHGADPNTNICGAKHEASSESDCYANESCTGGNFLVTHLYLCIEGNIPEGTVTIAYKYGSTVESLVIPGPGNCPDQFCLNPILSVELVAFSASKVNETAYLKWTTTTESNNDYFEIQRADHNNNFISIGKVKGSGNSDTPTSYGFTDKAPMAGTNFYRLRQVDFDGRTVISSIQSVKFNESLEASIYPNPTNDRLFISLNDWNPLLPTTFKVLDLNGSEVFTEEVKSVTTSVNVAQLSAGTYFIHITNNITTQVYRFIRS